MNKVAMFFMFLISASTSFAADYKALMIENDILVTNGKTSYLLKPQKLNALITQSNPIALIKVYGTDIWVTLDKDRNVEVIKSKFKNHEYFVLAPASSLKSTDKNYEILAQGNTFNKLVVYPADFCIECAKPTKISKRILKNALKVRAIASN